MRSNKELAALVLKHETTLLRIENVLDQLLKDHEETGKRLRKIMTAVSTAISQTEHQRWLDRQPPRIEQPTDAAGAA